CARGAGGGARHCRSHAVSPRRDGPPDRGRRGRGPRRDHRQPGRGRRLSAVRRDAPALRRSRVGPRHAGTARRLRARRAAALGMPVQPERRRLLRLAAASAAAALAPAAAFAAPSPSPTTSHARVRGGRVAGTREGGVHVFRGLRYGADTGPRRFLPPVREPAWRGMWDASTFGASAPQRGREGPGSEDCLLLNVWTPALRDGGRRPVLVYIHGGGFSTGSGSDPLYDGTRLCLRGDVVVVTLNHRLNAFGYLHLKDLLGPDYAASGNVGQL